jgi:competence protein ComEA
MNSSIFAQDTHAPKRVKIGQQSETSKININTADARALMTLKHIGKSKARKIIEDRKANGPFASVDDLTRIKGIGKGTVNKNRDRITAGQSAEKSEPTPRGKASGKAQKKNSKTAMVSTHGKASKLNKKSTGVRGKININTADARTLVALKSIGKSKATRIVEDRKANGPFTSVDDLTRIKGIGKGTVNKNRHLITIGDSKEDAKSSLDLQEPVKGVKKPRRKIKEIERRKID